MSKKRIQHLLALKRIEVQELEEQLIKEIKKEFRFFTFDQVRETLLQHPNQNMQVLSENDYYHMTYFEREGEVYPRYVMEAYVDEDGNLGIGGYSNRDGHIGNDRCRDTSGLYVWKKQQ